MSELKPPTMNEVRKALQILARIPGSTYEYDPRNRQHVYRIDEFAVDVLHPSMTGFIREAEGETP